MSRNVFGIAVAFALLVGGAMITSESANAGHHGCGGGGLFGHLRGNGCAGAAVHRGGGGGLFARLRGHHRNACCAPEPVCCAPEPVCCAPEPVCCAPEPTCCAPEPTCCGAAPVVQSDCCGATGVYGGSVVGGQPQYVEGHQQQQQGAYQQQGGQPQGGQQQGGQVSGEAGVPSPSDSVPPAPQADGASDAPPAPQPQ